MRDLAKGTTTLVSQGDSSCAPAAATARSTAGFAGGQRRRRPRSSSSPTSGSPPPTATTRSTSTCATCGRHHDAGLGRAIAPARPACGNGAFRATFWGVSPNGAKAFFATAESLVHADTDDGRIDIYARDLPNGPTTLVSQGAASCAPGCGNSSARVPVFRGSSDTAPRSSSRPTSSSPRPTPTPRPTSTPAICRAARPTLDLRRDRSRHVPAIFVGGLRRRRARLLRRPPSRWSAPTRTTPPTSTSGRAGRRPRHLRHLTRQRRRLRLDLRCRHRRRRRRSSSPRPSSSTPPTPTPAPTSTRRPRWGRRRWSRRAGSLRPACGNGASPAIFNGGSADASKVFFTTAESLAPQDIDTERRHLRPRPRRLDDDARLAPGVCRNGGQLRRDLRRRLRDGAHALLPDRRAADRRRRRLRRSTSTSAPGGQTRLVSTGNSVVARPGDAGADRDRPRLSRRIDRPRDPRPGRSGPRSRSTRRRDCSGVPVATGTSLELGGAGIAVTVAAGSTTSFRATATDGNGDTSPCSTPRHLHAGDAPPPPPPPPTPRAADRQREAVAPATARPAARRPGNGAGSPTSRRRRGSPSARPPRREARRPVFRFTDATGQPGTTFLCKVDQHALEACGSPTR